MAPPEHVRCGRHVRVNRRIGGGGHRGRLGHQEVHCGGAGISRRLGNGGDIDAGAAAETAALIRGVG